jgi:hypothetical protein
MVTLQGIFFIPTHMFVIVLKSTTCAIAISTILCGTMLKMVYKCIFNYEMVFNCKLCNYDITIGILPYYCVNKNDFKFHLVILCDFLF